MDEDSSWLCTQAMVVNDDRPNDGEEKSNDFGCIVLNNTDDDECYVLKEGDNTVGRHPSNNIFIEHPSVSMNHAVIQCDSDGVVLLDKGSLNKTRLNKKILKKAVAYFLDENALLMFGEVRAKYFVNSSSYNTTNESKSNESNGITIEKKTGNDDFPPLKLANTVVTSDRSVGYNTDCCSTSLVNETNSINKNISDADTKSKNYNGTLDNVCFESNSSNSSDAFLLDAVSQIEAVTDNVKSEITQNKFSEDPSSHVLGLTGQMSTVTNRNSLDCSKDESLDNSLREDTPSPVMNIGIELSNQFSTIGKVSSDETQSLKCMNEENGREDTPSPVMDLGVFSYSESRMYPETNNHDNVSTNESTNRIDDFDETQILDVKQHPSDLINQLDTNESNQLNECTQLPFTDDKCLLNTQVQKTQNVSNNIEGKSSLLDMQSNKNKCDETNTDTQRFQLNDDDLFKHPTQKCSASNPSVSFNQSINQTDNETKRNIEVFEEDDDIFLCIDDNAEFSDQSEIMKINLSKTCQEKTTDSKQVTSNENNVNSPKNKFNRINEVHTDEFFDCPTQKLSTSKHSHCTIKDNVPKQNVVEKKMNTFEADDDEIFSSFIQEDSKSQSHVSTSLKDDDYFNCPTQKLSIDKHINIKTEKFSIKHEKNQLPQPDVPSANTSKVHISSSHEEETQVPEINDDDDFFNCPTQKLSVTKKLCLKPKVSSTINIGQLQKDSQPVVTNLGTSKNCTSHLNNGLTQIPEMDDDFFNQPTQKIPIIKKINSNVNPIINEEEIQKLENCTNPIVLKTTNAKTCTSSLRDDLSQVPETDDDFFNCPTQKISNIKKINLKVNSTIHEEETQKLDNFPQPKVLKTTNAKTCTSSLHDDLTQVPEMDDDFFNCPTQKISNIKKINTTIHEEETQKLDNFPQPKVLKTTNAKTCTSSLHDDLTQLPEIDDDFFNQPTQKIPTIKKINSKVNPIIHEEKTQKLENCPKPIVLKTTNAKTFTSSLHDDLTQVPETDDDFFNCPTQKISNIKKINTTIHEEETQKLDNFPQPKVLKTTNAKTCTSSLHDDLTQVPETDDDFFNCPTQKISIIKKLNSKVNPSIKEEEETQKLQKHPQPVDLNISNSKASTSSAHNYLTQVPETDDDFFNCPTQKISIIKKINSKVDFTAHEEETQKLQELPKLDTNIIGNNTSHLNNDLTQVPEMDDDFFNCPTQKYSNIKNINSKVNSTIQEDETQTLEDFPEPNVLNTTNVKTYTSSLNDDVPEMDDDFFNCPTQKYTNKKITDSKVNSTIHEEETQKLETFLQPVILNTTTTSTCTSNTHIDPIQIPELDDDDFFNCPTQKISNVKKTNLKVNSSINEEETKNISKLGNQSISTLKTGTNCTSKSPTFVPESDNEDFFNHPKQKIGSNVKIKSSSCPIKNETIVPNINESGSQELPKQSDSNQGETKYSIFNSNNGHKSLRQKRTVVPVNIDESKIRKSMRIDSQKNSKLNEKLPIICKQNQNSSKSPKTSKEPLIRVRKDLHTPIPQSECLSNKSLNNTNKSVSNSMLNNTQSANRRINSPRRSKINENDLSKVSVKQEPLTDNSIGQVLTTHLKRQSEQLNETATFSPLNIPNLSANSSLEQCSTSTPDVDSLSLSSKQSSPSSVISKWQSFWNKKKMACQNKASTEETRYQTRANTKKYNIAECSRKRKQSDSVNVDNGNKRLCDSFNKRMSNPLNESTSEIVVTFSYLRNRHLQEMKQFVEKTRGYVTDDVTQCTVLVTDKIRCTMKTLSAIARGCPIVDANWVKHSYTVQMFQDVDGFILADKDTERKYKFRLKESLAKARDKKLLDGYTVLVTPSVKPGPKEMKVIITCAGGDYVMNWPKTRVQKGLIVTCDQDNRRWKPVWDNHGAQKIDCDTLVMSIIRQKLSLDS